MVVMRMTRRGAKKKPFYRIVVADKSFARDGRCIEFVGTHNPLAKEKGTQFKSDRVKYWLGCGVQPSETVQRLLDKFYKAS